MTQAASTSTALTVADLAELFGPIPAWRIRNDPAPGTATEQHLVEIEGREKRLYELVDGVLVEKTVGYDESCLAVELGRLIGNFVTKHLTDPICTGQGRGVLRNRATVTNRRSPCTAAKRRGTSASWGSQPLAGPAVQFRDRLSFRVSSQAQLAARCRRADRRADNCEDSGGPQWTC